MLGRPAPLWILAVLGTIGGLLCTLVVMQFAEVVPWAGDEGTYIGGRWTGVVFYAVAAAFFYAAAYAWLTVKPWAHMVTILAGIIGFFVPFISHMDGTAPISSAIVPILVSVPMLFMVFRPSTNRAMALALSGQGNLKTAKAPPTKPMSAARKRELAEEQKKTKAAPKPAATQPASTASNMATSAAATATAAGAAVSQAVASLQPASGTIPKAAAAAPVRPAFAGMAKSAAAMLGKTSGPVYKPLPTQSSAQPAVQAPAPAPSSGLPANQSRPRGFRADEV